MKILQLAIRTLLRFRLYTLVNVLGLALSLGSCILIFRYIHDQSMTNHFIPDIEKVCITVMEDEGNHQINRQGISPAYGEDIVNILQNPAIERSCIYYQQEQDQITVNNKLCIASTIAADTNFLKIIPLPILQASVSLLFEKPDEAAITASYASILFGDENPIGKKIRLSCGKTVTIKAILGEPYTRFSMPFDLIFSSAITDYARLLAPQTLIRLYNRQQLKEINRQHNRFIQLFSNSNRTRIQLLPLNQLYFSRGIGGLNDNWPKGDRYHLLILSAIAILILIIGLFNFINIYTVVVMKRAREFGMKKVFGANKKQLAIQLYTENSVMTTLSLFLAWTFVEIGSLVAEATMGISIVSYWSFDIGVSCIILLTLPCITALFPYIRYNYTQPIQAIHSIGRGGYSVVSRNLFLCLQYVLTILLIILSLFSIRQLNYMLNKDPGFQTENIILAPRIGVPIGSNMSLWDTYNKVSNQIENALKASPLFTDFDFNRSPLHQADYINDVRLPGEEWKGVKSMPSTESYFKMLGLQLKEGRLWNDSIDNYRTFNLIINETAQKLLGITDIKDATLVARTYFIYYSDMEKGKKPEYKIIGVVKDFTTGHLSKATSPLVFFHNQNGIQLGIMAKITPGKKQEAIRFLQEKYEELSNNIFHYTFLKDEVRAVYNGDKQLVQIASFFAIIAILISSMGLFSLSLFDVQQRFHEISIRKVNGANTFGILGMLLRKYYQLLGIAFGIATPIAWLAITLYLRDFAHKTPLVWWVFAIALLLTGSISFITLIWQIQKAARTNPAEIIRSE